MQIVALLLVALLFGGMTLYAFGFAAFIFHVLPAPTAGRVIRKAFPHFYLFVLGCSALAGGIVAAAGAPGAGIMAAIAATTLFARQVLMPAINAASDAGRQARFKWLHGLSVTLTLGHIGAAGVVLAWLAGA
ncbi:DUF4149 domain-containing protein [Roseovarius salinarum]|uniref:DUF4149 domain-containing protein n=1 Tax=Roseovarius salinarum TaxID=1981892 RepID=UPI000C3306B0|nr:DUF4149 domain-containing protein [Roseovarius salinarum]